MKPPAVRWTRSSSSRLALAVRIEEAKQVCRRCTVTEDCLRWAIDSGQDAGVWGGMSEDERRAYKRRTVRLRARATA
jgi:WhiB family redox-sensing transcriptional regulator